MGLKSPQILKYLFNLGRKTWQIAKQKSQHYKKTTLGKLQHDQAVNLEIDLIARYVARMLETQVKS